MTQPYSPQHMVRVILSTVQKYRTRWGTTLIASLLTGSERRRIVGNQLTESPHHGLLKKQSRARVSAMIDTLVDAALLTRGKFGCLDITGLGQRVLRDERAVTSSVLESMAATDERLRGTRRATKYGRHSEALEATLELIEDGCSPHQVAKERGVSIDTVAEHLLAIAERGESIDLRPWLDDERLKKIEQMARDWRPGVPLKTVQSRLGDDWPWHEIKTYLAQIVAQRMPGVTVQESVTEQRRDRTTYKGKYRATADDNETWSNRGYIPHYNKSDRPQFVTYRLGDSLPAEVLERIRRQASGREEMTARAQQYLDAGHGACWLEVPEFAEVVIENLHFHDRRLYRVLDWVIMPNHVHVAYDRPRAVLSQISHSWRSYTSQRIKPKTDIGEEDGLWQRGVFDRYIRDEQHLSNVTNYIYLNPVKAGLVDDPFDWPWSSIHKHGDIRPRLRSWWKAQSENFWDAPSDPTE